MAEPEGGGGPPAPFGRRGCEILANRASGGYRILTALDREGPEPQPGQFYMLAAEGAWGGNGGRPFLPRAVSVAEAAGAEGAWRLEFLLEDVGPGTAALCCIEPGRRLLASGPFGVGFSAPGELNPGGAGAILVGGGIGIAPLAIHRSRLSGRGVPVRVLLGFRDREHSGGVEELFGCSEVRLASEDGHAGHHGYVTDLLSVMLSGDDAGSAAVYSCGPPPMLEAVRAICAERGAPCELAMEAPMACGFGACFGCAVPLRGGGYLRLCLDGPVIDASRIESAMIAGAERP